MYSDHWCLVCLLVCRGLNLSSWLFGFVLSDFDQMSLFLPLFVLITFDLFSVLCCLIIPLCFICQFLWFFWVFSLSFQWISWQGNFWLRKDGNWKYNFSCLNCPIWQNKKREERLLIYSWYFVVWTSVVANKPKTSSENENIFCLRAVSLLQNTWSLFYDFSFQVYYRLKTSSLLPTDFNN